MSKEKDIDALVSAKHELLAAADMLDAAIEAQKQESTEIARSHTMRASLHHAEAGEYLEQ